MLASMYFSSIAVACVASGGDEWGEDGFGGGSGAVAGADVGAGSEAGAGEGVDMGGVGEGTQLLTASPMKTEKRSEEMSLFNLHPSSHRL